MNRGDTIDIANPELVYRDWLAFAFLEKVSDPNGAKHPVTPMVEPVYSPGS